jgi:hypothetical protein
MFKVKSPNHLLYAKKPLLLGGKIEKITPIELQKRVKVPFIYSEDIYSTLSRSPTFPEGQSGANIANKIIHRLKNPVNDQLVICDMGSVGHGLFTRRTIKIGEIVAIYSGELCADYDSEQSAYCLNVDSFAGKKGLAINAERRGGLARFIQHLPKDQNRLVSSIVSTLQSNPEQIEPYLAVFLSGDEFAQERDILAKRFTDDIRYNSGQLLRGMLNYKKETNHLEWEMDSLVLGNLKKTEIEIANLTMGTFVYKKQPLLYLWAEREIQAGAQLGFSYSLGYWAGQACLPRFFSKKGELLPTKKVRLNKMALKGKVGKEARVDFYSKTQYEKDIQQQQPVQIFRGSHPVSFFKVRKTLARNHVIEDGHLPLKKSNSHVAYLKRLLPADVDVEAYNRFPEAILKAESWNVDLVCSTQSLQRWAQLYLFFKQSNIAQRCRFLQYSKEIIIRGVNHETSDMHKFVITQKGNVKKRQQLFSKHISNDRLPQLPDKNDLVGQRDGRYFVIKR